ncbi:MAG: GNAT family N-acetyltransferase [Planctomycetes bacterium]|nr:GNAT family N-acetyltransferase [Planctomycetota bacterium]
MNAEPPYRIAVADSDAEVTRCFPVVQELRPHLESESFRAQVRRQMKAGYSLVFLEVAGEIQALAGFRFGEFLAWGRILYVDDLVTRKAAQSHGYGGALFDWLVARAEAEDCDQLHLDSGVQRFAAHRFYLKHGMDITSHHFAMRLGKPGAGSGPGGGTVSA